MPGINKQFKLTLLILILVFGSIFFWNVLRHYLIKHALEKHQPIVYVSAARAQFETWKPYLYAVGTLSANTGVSVSTQEAGNVVLINFQSGQHVKKGDLLVQLDDRTEQAQLQNNIATFKLAEITYMRNKELLERNATSKQAFDEAAAKYQQAQASVAQIQATIAHKHITAPFDGKTGIRNVDLGQYVKPGDNIVSLENLNPIFANFYLPEKSLHQLYVGQPINLTVDPAPKRIFSGKINAWNSLVDVETHNIAVQATVPNQSEILYPGLFARIKVTLPEKKNVVSVPQTAINYSLYGNTVFVVKNEGKDRDKKDILITELREVDVGDQRDHKIMIIRGLKAGEWVVTSGQLKLKNGQRVFINNSVIP